MQQAYEKRLAVFFYIRQAFYMTLYVEICKREPSRVDKNREIIYAYKKNRPL